jgi:ABC-type nickel/cobalt efflux system permease component RcnA
MIFALSQGLLIAGIFSAFAMAFGTAITVSVLASLAVGSRELAKRMAGGGESRLAGAVATGAGLIGSALVFLMGASFFVSSLGGGAAPPL